MALFVDGNPSEPTDLSPYETSIFSTATTEGIDLVAKGTVAALEIGLELQRFLVRTPGGGSFGLANVAATDALRQWHILHTLAVTFRDAHHQQLNDRYKKKWKTYVALAAKASELVYQIGVGLVYAPLPRPAIPIVGQTLGTQAGQTCFVKVSWTDNFGVESLSSLASSFNTSEGSALTVRAIGAPRTARGWNVYVGASDDQVERQNTGLLALGSTWQMPAGSIAAGIRPGAGQVPDQYLRRSTVVFRG